MIPRSKIIELRSDAKNSRELVYAICRDPMAFRMSIPPQPDDSDNLFIRTADGLEAALDAIEVLGGALRSYAGYGRYSNWESLMQYVTYDKFGGLCAETAGPWEARDALAKVFGEEK